MESQPSQPNKLPSAMPRYDLQSMVDVLGSLGINITIKELNKPTPEQVLMVHKGFLEACLSVQRANHDMDPVDLSNLNEEDAKAHSETFKLLHLYKLIGYFQDMCVLESSFMEIFNPTKKMFHKQITYALSFCKFEFSELAPFGDLQKSNRAYLDDCRKVKEEDEELLRNIHTLKQARKEKHERIERAKLRRDELKKKLEDSLAEQKMQQERDAKINKETEMVMGEKEEALARLEAIQKKMVLYDKLLIKSPTRLRSNIDKIDARIVELDKLIRSKGEELEEQKKNLFDKDKFIENFRSCTELLNMFYENDVLSANAKIKEIEKTREEIQNHICLQKQLQSDIAEHENECQKLQSELKTREKTASKKTTDSQARITVAQKNIKDKEKQVESVKAKLAEALEQRQAQVEKFKQTQDRSLAIIDQCYKIINTGNVVQAGKEAFQNSLVDKTNLIHDNFIKSTLEHNKFLDNIQKEMNY